MTVIFMENCFQILEKNKILESLLKNQCWPARSVSTVRKRSFFLVCKVYWFLLYKFQPRQNFPAFSIFLHFERNSQLSQNLEILGNLKLKQSQLSSSFPSCKYLLKFSSFKNFWYGPLQLLSNSQLQSQLKTTAKIWKSSKILVRRVIILLKNTTARERNQIKG